MMCDDDYDKKSDFDKTIDDLDDLIFLNYITKDDEDENRNSGRKKCVSLPWKIFLVVGYIIIIVEIIRKFF